MSSVSLHLHDAYVYVNRYLDPKFALNSQCEVIRPFIAEIINVCQQDRIGHMVTLQGYFKSRDLHLYCNPRGLARIDKDIQDCIFHQFEAFDYDPLRFLQFRTDQVFIRTDQFFKCSAGKIQFTGCLPNNLSETPEPARMAEPEPVSPETQSID